MLLGISSILKGKMVTQERVLEVLVVPKVPMFSAKRHVTVQVEEFSQAPACQAGEIQPEDGRREDTLHRVRALCTPRCVQKGRKTQGIQLSRIHALLRENREGILQGEAPYKSQENEARSAQLFGLGT